MKYKISELGKVIGGGTPSTKHSEYYTQNGIGWITPKDLSNYNKKIICHGARDITSQGLENSSAKILPKQSILISSRAPIGYVAIAGEKLATSQGFKSIIPDTDKILPDYLYYLMLKNKDNLEKVASGSTFKEISGKTMKKFEVEVPPIKDQRKILSLINPIVDKIELNNQINDNLLELANSMFKNYFNHTGTTRLSTYFLPKRGKNLLKRNVIPGDVPVVAGGLKPAAYHNSSNTKSPVITISASGANAGFVQIWGKEVWSSDSSYIDSSITPYIYFWYLFLKNKQDVIFDSQSGSAQPHIYPKHIGNLIVPNIDSTKIHQFNSLVSPLFKNYFNNQEINNNLEKIKESLLSKYFD